MKYRKIILRVLLHGLFLLVLYVLESMVFSRLPILGIKPTLLPIAVVGVGLFEGSLRGCIFGFFAGLLADMSLDTAATFAAVLPLVGLLIGLLSEKTLARGFPSYALCSIGALCITAFAQMFNLLFFVGADTWALVRTGLLQVAYSALFILPFYYPARRLGRGVKFPVAGRE